MKQICFLFLAFIFSISAMAEHYTTEDAGFRARVIALGRYKSTTVMFTDGHIEKGYVKDYRDLPDGSFQVDFINRDEMYITPSHPRVQYEGPPGEPSEAGEIVVTSAKSSSSGLGGVDGSVGVQAGIGSVIQYILLEGSPAAKAIDRAYKQIAAAERQIARDEQAIISARVDLRTGVLTLERQIAAISNAHPLKYPSVADVEIFKNSYNSTDPELKNYKFESPDENFRAREEFLRERILSAKGTSLRHREIRNIAKYALVEADRTNAQGDLEHSEFLINFAKGAADLLVGIDPITGTFRNAYELVTGKNLITGIPLSTGERIIAGLGVATLAYATDMWKAYKWLTPIAQRIAPEVMAGYRAFGEFLRTIGQESRFARNGTVLRKINIFSEIEPRWGLTHYHLDKHFYGTKETSLRIIDSSGNADIWLKNLAELAQSPITKVEKDGAITIIKTFTKTDGSGTYKMGTSLFERPDGTFDLVNILTDQKKFAK